MKNLMEAIDESLSNLGYAPISDIVNNKKKCISYINRILKSVDNKVTIPFGLALNKYDFRVKHILFSFGLGVLIARFCNLDKKIEEEYKKYKVNAPFAYIWLTLCIYHDYGYFSGISYIKSDDLDRIAMDYSIFDFDFCVSRYSRKLYRAYYMRKYTMQNWESVDYDLSAHEEIGDHGIIGGYLLFQQLYASEQKKAPPSKHNSLLWEIYQRDEAEKSLNYHPERIPLYQDICYRIMEHNIWKDYCDESDFEEICGDNFKKIGISEPLQYLLSLVDTIEMTKKFCRYTDEGSEKEHFVYPKTLGRKVSMRILSNEIEIDYQGLREYIRENRYNDDISLWEDSVRGLEEWVTIQTGQVDGRKDVIVLKYNNP